MLASFSSLIQNNIPFINTTGFPKPDPQRSQSLVSSPKSADTDETDEGGEVKRKDMVTGEAGEEREQQPVKRRRERAAHETFIVVRPPPSVSNHPLNLQLQLVPPHDRGSRRSTDTPITPTTSITGQPPTSSPPADLPTFASAASRPQTANGQTSTDSGSSVERKQSLRSNRSDTNSVYSSLASSTSLSSIASTSSTASGRRMIIPLYTLSAHNVMQNTILDAGTDAKVAKFHKRGLELVGLAMMEVIEFWSGGGGLGLPSGYGSKRSSTVIGHDLQSISSLDHDDRLSHLSHPSPQHSPPRTPQTARVRPELTPDPHVLPTGSAQSLSSTSGSIPPTTLAAPNIMTTAPSPTVGGSSTKRFMGRIFKKKDKSANSSISSSQNITPTPTTMGPPHPPSASNDRNSQTLTPANLLHAGPSFLSAAPTSRRRKGEASASSAHSAQTSSYSRQGSNFQPTLQPPILGIQSTLHPSCTPASGRPIVYAWVIRKWLKGGSEGLLGNVMGKLNVNVPNLPHLGRGSEAHANSLTSEVEVRFEWTRSDKKGKKKEKERKRFSALSAGSDPIAEAVVGEEKGRRSGASATTSARSRSPRPQSSAGRAGSPGTQTTNTETTTTSTASTSDHEDDDSPTRASGGRRSKSKTRARKKRESKGEDVDDGEDSDPEDSETPWNCYLVVSHHPIMYPATPLTAASTHSRKGSYGQQQFTPTAGDGFGNVQAQAAAPQFLGAPHGHALEPSVSRETTSTMNSAGATASQPKSEIRLKVASISPAPHHPKVAAQLKVPFPLPDISVTDMVVHKRVITPDGVARPSLSIPPPGSGSGSASPSGAFSFGLGQNGHGMAQQALVLTAEEIKDILSCTGLWLVVREAFGGVGKQKRPGDGWRIRG